jgi:hypothetical protein
VVKVLSLEEINPTEWDDFLKLSINSTVFTTFEWCSLWKASYPGAFPLFLVKFKNKEIQSALPLIMIHKRGFKSYYSMPYGKCGGIISRSEEVDIDEILYEFNKLAKGKWGMLGITTFTPLKGIEKWSFEREECETYMLNLKEKLKIRPNKRGKIRKCKKLGIKVKNVTSLQEVEECYKMVKDTAKRQKRGVKLSFNFYSNLLHFMKKYLQWRVAIYESKLIGMTVSFYWKGTINMWDSAFFTSYLKYPSSDFLMWDIIEWGRNNEYITLDMGGAPTSGLKKFKEEWSGKRVIYFFYFKKSPIFSFLKRCQRLIK